MSENNVESGIKSKSKKEITVKEEPTSPSGTPCTCEPQKRNTSCIFHGG